MSHAETIADGLLAQHKLLVAVIHTEWATRLDHKVAAVIIERYMRKQGNSRASLRYLEKATGAQRPNVIASTRRLLEHGVFHVLRPGEGTRPTEYGLNFGFAASGNADDTAKRDLSSGIAGDTTGGIVDNTSSGPSGIAGDTKDLLTSPADKPADSKVGNEDTHAAPTAPLSAALTGADAEAARDPEDAFSRFWKAFPRKYQKPKARAAWDKLSPGDDLAERIVDVAARWAEHYREHPVEKKWIPAPANWLAGERYDEDLPEVYVDAKEAAIAKAKDRPRKKDVPAQEPSADNDDIPDFMIGSPQLWPRGRHVVEIVGSDVVQEGSDEKVIIRFRVVGGPHDGEEVTHRFWVQAFIPSYQEEGQAYLADICNAIGVGEIEDTAELHGRALTATAMGDRIEYAEIEVAA